MGHPASEYKDHSPELSADEHFPPQVLFWCNVAAQQRPIRNRQLPHNKRKAALRRAAFQFSGLRDQNLMMAPVETNLKSL